MPTEAKIKAKYITAHGELEKQYYKYGLIPKEEFDQLHGQNWNDMETELLAEGYLTPPTPPLSTHWAVIESINVGNEKPALVRRTWEGREYSVNCYVTENIKDQYQAGDIVVGDFVLVEFLEDSADRAVVFSKVYRTW